MKSVSLWSFSAKRWAAVHGEDRVYRAGPVLELAAHSPSPASRLRAAALPPLHRLDDRLQETANLTPRTGDTARFAAGCAVRLEAVRLPSRCRAAAGLFQQ
jgi:DNA-binding IclR family transcriptional regulator